MSKKYEFSTGLSGLDNALSGLRSGDNVVWQSDSIEDYISFVRPYRDYCIFKNIPLIYIRFARHKPLLKDHETTAAFRLNPIHSFEKFIFRIHSIIHEYGKGCCYLFDCLSELSTDWHSDRMLGNFFMLICPYLGSMDTIAYFSLLRNRHSVHATSPILNVTQLFLDIYNDGQNLYVHPLKVDGRYSSTMNSLHKWQGSSFTAVRTSDKTSRILSGKTWSRLDSSTSALGYWNKTFEEAERLQNAFESGHCEEAETKKILKKLLRMIFSRDSRILELATHYLSLKDVLLIKRRMIGSGLIGGKSSGFLLARAILNKVDPDKWLKKLEPHDSFYIGSDVFYTFLVQNGVWWIRQQQRDPDHFLKGIERARLQILNGSFDPNIIKQFIDLLDYFGQWPFIVRSSSLMEDGFGNIFAGKYDSIFCPNQGSRGQRLAAFIEAVRQIYASAVSSEALTYRKQKGLLDQDEQMALLVQRVSGINYKKYFFPQAAGVGFSFNPYVWSEHVEPEAGLLRLVFGLGTRAVNRADDDYTRVIALNEPLLQPLADLNGYGYTQQKVDVLDLEENGMFSLNFKDVIKRCPEVPMELFAEKNRELEVKARKMNLKDFFPWMINFKTLLSETEFSKDMQDMLKCLEKAYGSTVDIEFTLNFFSDDEEFKQNYMINLVQCRPLELKSMVSRKKMNRNIPTEDMVIRSTGPVIGQSRVDKIDRIIYVRPESYGYLPEADRHSVARLTGRIVREHSYDTEQSIMLIGPGRWGTSIASLGVPVSFAEISRVSVLCEIVAMRRDFAPDVSLGTHFFTDLIEFDILYLALYPDKEGHYLNRNILEASGNRLVELMPAESRWSETVFVIDRENLPGKSNLHLFADAKEQLVLAYMDHERQA